MNEPVKKPGQQPESYQPKKPEMMRALEEAQGQGKINVIEESPQYRIAELPEFRIFGIEGVIGKKQKFRAAHEMWQHYNNGEENSPYDTLIQDAGGKLPWLAPELCHIHAACDYREMSVGTFPYMLFAFAAPGSKMDGYKTMNFPAGAWAMFSGLDMQGQNPGDVINAQRQRFAQWLISSEYEQAPGLVSLEIYGWKNNDMYVDVWFPLHKKAPESYQPKKPEMMRALEEAQGVPIPGKPYAVKTENGGSYIDGIPLLKWGEWRDSSYCGCLTTLLNAIGIPVSYEEVMGLSGVCWQAIMAYCWDPSGQMPQNGKLCEKNVGDALGIAVYTLKREKAIRRHAKASIDAGIPFLLVGGRWAPEWCLVCGYTVEDGREKFFGRTFFDSQNDNVPERTIEGQSTRVPESEIYTENLYFYTSGFPGVVPHALTRFYDKKRKPISRKQALKVSLETSLMMFELPSKETHAFGYDAYDVLIEGLSLNDAAYQAKCKNDCYHIGSMLDARRAAYIYLRESAGLLAGENKAKLAKIADIYKTMFDNLLAAVPYEKTSPVFDNNSDAAHWGAVWDAQRRRTLVSALRENKELERQARVIIADILEHWGNKK